MERAPLTHAMFSAEGDQAVAEAVEAFLVAATPLADKLGVQPGPERLALLQDETILTRGGHPFDMWIGQTDEPWPPEPLWERRYESADYSSV